MSGELSAFGQYRGYSERRYASWSRAASYVEMRDGVRLAADILRPSDGSGPVAARLPAIWTHTRYQRASLTASGEVVTTVESWDEWLLEVIRHGYVVVTVDVRGGGASFGVNTGQYSAEEACDAYDVTEWIAAQPWCDGNVGMYGRSYLGITQYFAASQAPPHLKAIFPEMASFDHYGYAYAGGVFREASRFNWQLLVGNLDHSVPTMWKGEYSGPVAPVDDDARTLQAALRAHRANLDWYRMLEDTPCRDSVEPRTGEPIHETRSPGHHRRAVELSGVPIYHLAGWFDMFPRDTLLWWRNLGNVQKVVIGPWYHVDREHLDDAAEHLRWYDHWLKGIDNGVLDEEPIHYWTLDAPPGEEWRSTPCWPLAGERRVTFHLAPGPSGSVASSNDGRLLREAPAGDAHDEYLTDYTTTTGLTNRWANANGGPTGYPDMRDNDEKGITYTTDPLTEDVEVTGHPVITLWVSSEAPDGAFYAYLEDVHPDGFSQYVTEGVLLASHRKLSDPPWDNLELPYHSGLAEDIEPLGTEAVALVFDLHPTSKRFAAGHRIRVTVTAADCDNDRVPVFDPPPRVRVYTGVERSRIELPVVERP